MSDVSRPASEGRVPEPDNYALQAICDALAEAGVETGPIKGVYGDQAEAAYRAAARFIVPALLAEKEKEVERLRGELQTAEDAMAGAGRIAGRERDRADQAEAERAVLQQQLREVRERLENLERFGLRGDADHPGFSEIGEVAGGHFLRREQVLAALSTQPDPGTDEPSTDDAPSVPDQLGDSESGEER